MKNTEAKVGALVVLSAVILCITFYFVGNAQFGRTRTPYRTYLRYAGGLAPGTDVLFGGITVGKVTAVRPDTADPTRIQIELEVKQGLVTPVQAKLTPGGTSTVLEKETRTGSTYYGRAGRSTRITGNESNAYHVVLNQQAPLAYSRKELMPYAVKN